MMLVALKRVFDRWPGAWTGVTVATLGIALLAIGYAAQLHASQAAVVAPGERYELRGSGPVHAVGVVSPGDDGMRPASCTVTGDGRTTTTQVEVRADRFDSIRAGRLLTAPGRPHGTVVCDQAVAFTTGPMLNAYPLATSRSLLTGYGALVVLGAGYAAFTLTTRRRHSAKGDMAPALKRDGAAPGGAQLRPGVAALFTTASAGTLGVVAVAILGWPPAAALLTPVLLAAVLFTTILAVGWSNLADRHP